MDNECQCMECECTNYAEEGEETCYECQQGNHEGRLYEDGTGDDDATLR